MFLFFSHFVAILGFKKFFLIAVPRVLQSFSEFDVTEPISTSTTELSAGLGAFITGLVFGIDEKPFRNVFPCIAKFFYKNQKAAESETSEFIVDFSSFFILFYFPFTIL